MSDYWNQKVTCPVPGCATTTNQYHFLKAHADQEHAMCSCGWVGVSHRGHLGALGCLDGHEFDGWFPWVRQVHLIGRAIPRWWIAAFNERYGQYGSNLRLPVQPRTRNRMTSKPFFTGRDRP